jgi:hypothetical protein
MLDLYLGPFTWWWLDYKINHIIQGYHEITHKKPIEMIFPILWWQHSTSNQFSFANEGIIGSKSSPNYEMITYVAFIVILQLFKFVVQRILWKGSWWPTFQKGENLGVNFFMHFHSLHYGKVLKTVSKIRFWNLLYITMLIHEHVITMVTIATNTNKLCCGLVGGEKKGWDVSKAVRRT